MIRIETERLLLRTPGEADLAAYLAYRNEPASVASQHMSVAGEDEALVTLRREAEAPDEATGWRMLGIEEKGEVAAGIIGEVGVYLHPKMAEGNMGWWLHSQKRGRGLATEAARGLIDWCFAVRRLHRVTAGCLVNNHDSLRVMTRLGMRLETRSIESRLIGEQWYDEFGCAVLAREWAEARATAGRVTDPGFGSAGV